MSSEKAGSLKGFAMAWRPPARTASVPRFLMPAILARVYAKALMRSLSMLFAFSTVQIIIHKLFCFLEFFPGCFCVTSLSLNFKIDNLSDVINI